MSAAVNVDVSASSEPTFSQSAWCVTAAFGTYFCMYAFRKPFNAATYKDQILWGLGYKEVLVIAQTVGYALSKFLGIKIIAEMEPRRRVVLLLQLIAGAEAALLLFAITPVPFNVFWLFVNGLPLGMVFGLVLGFLEGRRHTEALTAGLCISFIVASGITKSEGTYLLEAGVDKYWMPFAAGLLFTPPLLFFAWMLTRVPAPSPKDVAARSQRAPMSREERWRFFLRYAPGLTLLIVVFVLITILRSVRDDFAPEIWAGLQTTVPGSVFTWSELAVGAGVLLLNGSAVLIQDSRRAFLTGILLGIGGVLLVLLAVAGLWAGLLSPFAFMVLHGLGLYLPYIAVHTTIFERLIAMTRDRGNIGFLMYLADSCGYLGYGVVLLTKNTVFHTERWLPFFLTLSWVLAAVCFVLLVPCGRYFAMHPATQTGARAKECA